jgi:hypothetical protein
MNQCSAQMITELCAKEDTSSPCCHGASDYMLHRVTYTTVSSLAVSTVTKPRDELPAGMQVTLFATAQSRPDLELGRLPIQRVPQDFTPRVKRLRCEAGHSPHAYVELCIHSLINLHVVVLS